jgi:transcriptional regulator with XRE-family HTH domain
MFPKKKKTKKTRSYGAIRFSDRTVTPNGKRIRERRRLKNLSPGDLGTLAQCSAKTIENMESGKNVFWFTINNVANALECDVEDICLRPIRDKPTFNIPNAVVINVSLDLPIQNFDQSDELCRLLDRLIAMVRCGHSTIVDVRPEKGDPMSQTKQKERDKNKK